MDARLVGETVCAFGLFERVVRFSFVAVVTEEEEFVWVGAEGGFCEERAREDLRGDIFVGPGVEGC